MTIITSIAELEAVYGEISEATMDWPGRAKTSMW